MTTNKQITFATANLFNFLEPPGAFYDFANIYERDEWTEKYRWTKNQVEALDADILGVQEVFSIDAAQALFAEIGFPYFVTVDTPAIVDDFIYSEPVVGLASKYPITSFCSVTPDKSMTLGYKAELSKFSRMPIYATIDVPDIGEITIYVCHLKSQRPTESIYPEQHNPLIGQWISSQTRGWEAIMLRLFMENQYRQHPTPTILMGDMNQSLTSDITGLLTQEVSQVRDSKQLVLQDSWDIFTETREELARSATHYHFSQGNVLDYILLSQEFQTNTSCSLADITQYKTLDIHLINNDYDRDKQSSDHAFVSVTARFLL